MTISRITFSRNLSRALLLLFFAVLLIGTSVSVYILRHRQSVNAAVGINETMNFQGRLLTDEGAVVPDGSYNIEFKIYCGGDGALGATTDGDCSDATEEDLLWTETREDGNKVLVKNGYFSVYLGSVTAFGSNVDWNQDELYLSINIGGTGTPSYDGEMDPFTRLGSTPYSLNSKMLGGLESSEFLQLAQGVQTDSSTSNPSIYLNKTGATANILQLQRGGTDVLSIGNGGSAAFKTTTDSTTGFRIQDADGGTSVFNVDTVNERIGIGTDAPSYKLDIADSSTSTVAGADNTLRIVASDTGNVSSGNDESRGISVEMTRTGASSGATITSVGVYSQSLGDANTDNNYAFFGLGYGGNNNYGFRGGALSVSNFTSDTNVGLLGAVGTLFSAGSTTTNAYALQGTFNMDSGAGSFTNAAGLKITTATNSSGGTVTSNYGVQVDSQSIGGDNYGIAIGYADTHTLWVNETTDSTDEAGGIVFGASADTNLYRSAANTLRTDDDLLIRSATDSISALQVQNSSGTPLFGVGTIYNVVYIGNPTPDTTGALLVLDTKTDSGDPTGSSGAMYYNSNAEKFRCYENGAWKDCLSAATYPNITLLSGSETDTNAPATEREFQASRTRMWTDLTNARQFRWVWVRGATAGAAGYDCSLQYSTNESSWNDLDGVDGAELAGATASTTYKSSWTDITAGAKTDVAIRVWCKDGDGAVDPVTRNINVQFR